MLTEEQIEKVALDFVKKPGMHGYIEVGDLIDFARALLAAHSAEVQEPVAWRYQSEDPLDGGEWLLSDTKPNRRNIQPLYAHPQPISAAARGAAYAKLRQPFARPPYEALTSIPLRGAWSDVRERLAYAGRVAETVTRSCEIQLQQRLAEIERIDRASTEGTRHD